METKSRNLPLPIGRLLVTLLVTASNICPSLARPGEYITTQTLENKWLPDPMKIVPIVDPNDCKKYCFKDPVCDGYAVSAFERKCRLHVIKPGVPPVKNNGYRIFIRMKTEEEGYYTYNTEYLKIILDRKNAIDAAKECRKERGKLASVRNPTMDKLIWTLMKRIDMWTALIGIQRPSHDKPWEYSDGGAVSFTNWEWNGVWPRINYNCALTQNTISGPVWKHVDCWEKNYFVCQIPMF